MPVQRTPEQEAVVKNRGGGLLVSAAAGSGKTRVLVERLLDRILTEGKNVDEFLIITFTRAAAEELRGRIGQELAQALAAQPDNGHLRRQSGKLYQTQISTIHAFCTVLLRQWGHLLDVPADFALCEEEEAQVLMDRTLNQVLEARYEEVDPEGNFARLLDILSAGRDDSRLMDITLDVYGKIQSAQDPLAWLEVQRKALDLSGVTDVGQTPWGALLLEEARDTAAYWAGQMAKACALSQEDAALEKAYGESLQTTQQGLETFCQAASQGWDQAAQAHIPFPRLKAARGVEAIGAQEQIKAIREGCKKAVEGMLDPFASDSAALLEDMALVYPAMMGLIDLVEDFSQAYAQEKKKRNLLDFSDLEHFAVRLLTDEVGQPTDLARQWGAQYTEIMVDEYQDTNEVQNTIFQALSQGERNLFLVGDVKQSIYRFRLADPTIFLEKYRTFPPYDQAREGESRRITLSKNFRSRPQVLEAANDLFRNIMSRQLGEMDYTDQEALYPGGTFPEGEGYETEYHVLDFTQDPALTQDKQNRAQLEARFVAREIAGLLREGFPVSDGQGGTRPLQPEDVAILLRSPGPVRSYYTQALEEAGVAWSAEEGGDLFATTEVSVALSWLQIIDNPHQDIPLLAVLRSPLVGMTGDRLAAIRTLAEGDFYTALQAAGEQGWGDCQAFLDQLADLRFGAGEQTCHQLLWALYRRTDMLPVFSAMSGGEKRRENLLTFSQLARRFEGTGHKGLFGFLLHLNRVRGGHHAGGPQGGDRGEDPVHPPVQGVGVPGGLPLRPGPAAELFRHPEARPLPPQAGVGPQGTGPGDHGGVSHPGPDRGGPGPEEGDAGRGDAPALRGHDPGQGETHPHPQPPLWPHGPEKLGGEPSLPRRSPGAGGVLHGGAMGPAHRHGPAGGGRPSESDPAGGPSAAPKRLGPGLEDLLPPRGRVPGGGPAARPIGTRDGGSRAPGGTSPPAPLALPPFGGHGHPGQSHRHPGGGPGPGRAWRLSPARSCGGAGSLPAAPVCPGDPGPHPGPAGYGGAHGDAEHPPGPNRLGSGCGRGAGPPDPAGLPHPCPGPDGGPPGGGPLLCQRLRTGSVGGGDHPPGVSLLRSGPGREVLSPDAGGGGGSPAGRGGLLV